MGSRGTVTRHGSTSQRPCRGTRPPATSPPSSSANEWFRSQPRRRKLPTAHTPCPCTRRCARSRVALVAACRSVSIHEFRRLESVPPLGSDQPTLGTGAPGCVWCTWCCLAMLKFLRKNSYFQLQSPLSAAARTCVRAAPSARQPVWEEGSSRPFTSTVHCTTHAPRCTRAARNCSSPSWRGSGRKRG